MNVYESKYLELKKEKLDEILFLKFETDFKSQIWSLKTEIDQSLNHFMSTENYVGKYIPV